MRRTRSGSGLARSSHGGDGRVPLARQRGAPHDEPLAAGLPMTATSWPPTMTERASVGRRAGRSSTAIEGARATISRVSLFYGARSAAALAAVGTLEAASPRKTPCSASSSRSRTSSGLRNPRRGGHPRGLACSARRAADRSHGARCDPRREGDGARRSDDRAWVDAGPRRRCRIRLCWVTLRRTPRGGQGHPAPRADYAGPCRREKRSAKRARGACAVMTRRCICTSIRRRGRSSCPRGGRAAEIYLARARLAGWRSSRGSVSRSHGVAVSMGDPPLGVLASVHLSYAQCGCPPLAINGGGDVLESCGLRHVADHVVRDHLDGK